MHQRRTIEAGEYSMDRSPVKINAIDRYEVNSRRERFNDVDRSRDRLKSINIRRSYKVLSVP